MFPLQQLRYRFLHDGATESLIHFAAWERCGAGARFLTNPISLQWEEVVCSLGDEKWVGVMGIEVCMCVCVCLTP